MKKNKKKRDPEKKDNAGIREIIQKKKERNKNKNIKTKK
jgi:hypothetical protein